MGTRRILQGLQTLACGSMMRAILLLLSACSFGEWPSVERGEPEARARDIVWSSFGATDEAPPSVTWETGEHCPSRDDGTNYIVIGSEGGTQWKCLLGWYWSPDHHARVIWRGSISASAYAHELYHAWMLLHTGDLDPDHWDPGWSTIVPQANALLRDAGL